MANICHPIALTLHRHFERLYGPGAAADCMDRLAMMLGRYGVGAGPRGDGRTWSERDHLLITYADMVTEEGASPLATFRKFHRQRLRGLVNSVHLLPFFPYSSDDGFSVIDYRDVAPQFGTWKEIEQLGAETHLMFDLVLNHVSSQSTWFKQYVSGYAPYRDYFLEVEAGTDLSAVVRPRNHPLLRKIQTRSGERFVWVTFSDDQVDLDFTNPHVLFEFLDILFLYVSRGARIIRLDAIAYLWKEIGTRCIHLEETHEVVKLLRAVLELVAPEVWLLTETNVPHEENISYFGEGDEAQMIYQFTLPPLVLHALLTGTSEYLTAWAADLSPPPPGCTYLNFTASHDGIGVRPVENILPPAEFQLLAQGVSQRGGYVSTKRNADGSESPYELNITYCDALRPMEEARADLHEARFLCSQAIPLCMKGIPAVYFNSLVAAPNNEGGVEYTGQARTINRGKWQYGELNDLLEHKSSSASKVFSGYARMLQVRSRQPAFHPDGSQDILALGHDIFAVARTAPGGSQRILALHNLTDVPVRVQLSADARAFLQVVPPWHDVLSGRKRGDARNSHVQLRPYEVVWLA